MRLACNQLENCKEFKQQYSLAAIDGEISSIDFYLTLSHRFLYKENNLQVIYEEEEGTIMLEKFLQKGDLVK